MTSFNGVRSVARARRRRCAYRTAIGTHCMRRSRPALRRRGPVVSLCTAVALQSSSRRGEAVFAAVSAWASSRRDDVSRRRAGSAARPRRRRAIGRGRRAKVITSRRRLPTAASPRSARLVAVVVLSKSAAASSLTSSSRSWAACAAPPVSRSSRSNWSASRTWASRPDLGELCAGPLSLGRDLEV